MWPKNYKTMWHLSIEMCIKIAKDDLRPGSEDPLGVDSQTAPPWEYFSIHTLYVGYRSWRLVERWQRCCVGPDGLCAFLPWHRSLWEQRRRGTHAGWGDGIMSLSGIVWHSTGDASLTEIPALQTSAIEKKGATNFEGTLCRILCRQSFLAYLESCCP